MWRPRSPRARRSCTRRAAGTGGRGGGRGGAPPAPGAPILREGIGSNVVAEWRQQVGGVDAALRGAAITVRTRIRLARGGAQPPAPPAPRASHAPSARNGAVIA